MTISAQSGLLASIVSVAVVLSVLLRTRRGVVTAMFTAFSANLFIHFISAFLGDLSGDPLWARIDLISASLLPVTALLFFGRFLWREPVMAGRYLRGTYVSSALLLVFLLSPWSPPLEAVGADSTHATYSLVSTSVVMAYAFAGLYLCAWLVWGRYKELESRRERTRLRYLLILHLLAVSFVLLGMLPGPLGFLRTWGDLVSAFYLYFVSQSLLKHRLLDMQELLGRTLVLTGVALLLATVFGLLVILAGASPEVSLFHTFVASIVIMILFEPLRDKLEGSASRLFFRERFEMRRKLEELRREIANIISLDRMTKVLLDSPYDSLRISHTSLYLVEPGGTSYRLVDHRGTPPIERLDLASHRTFFEGLKRKPTVVLSESLERQLAEEGAPVDSEPSPNARRARQILDTLEALHAGICIPLLGQDEILGLWCLHDESAIESYSADEIALLMAVGEQAAINIENSRLFEKVRERDRLAVLGEMAAGLAHEIRNPLGAIKGAAQYLEPTGRPGDASPPEDDAGEFLQIIIEEVDRLNRVVNQFLDYARPFQVTLTPTQINRVVNQSLRLIETECEQAGIHVKTQLEQELQAAQANDELLTQVLLNLFRNAIEAMTEGGSLQVSTRSRSSAGFQTFGKHIVIEVKDTGPGLDEEAARKVFLPFFTTKERGTGLGLAISQRIVQQQGGELRLRSHPGEGATFIIELPMAETGLPVAEAHGSEQAGET